MMRSTNEGDYLLIWDGKMKSAEALQKFEEIAKGGAQPNFQIMSPCTITIIKQGCKKVRAYLANTYSGNAVALLNTNLVS